MWDESAKRMWGYSHLSSSCFTTPNLLLSILLSQAEPAYDYDWQTFQPWKHCLFLAVICAAAAEKKNLKKGLRRILLPSFPRNVSKMDTLIISSLYQPTLFRSEEQYTAYCLPQLLDFGFVFFSTSSLLLSTSVSASVCAKSSHGRA